MLGFMGICRTALVGGDSEPPGPISEYVGDPEINDPTQWDNDGPGGQGSIVAFGRITSIDEDGTRPTSSPLVARLTPGAQYRVKVQFGSSGLGPTRVFVLNTTGDIEQLLFQEDDSNQLREEVFTAGSDSNWVRFRFFGTGIRINSVSIMPEPSP